MIHWNDLAKWEKVLVTITMIIGILTLILMILLDQLLIDPMFWALAGIGVIIILMGFGIILGIYEKYSELRTGDRNE